MEGDVQPSAHTEINDVCQIFRLSKSCFHEQDLVVTAEKKNKHQNRTKGINKIMYNNQTKKEKGKKNINI